MLFDPSPREAEIQALARAAAAEVLAPRADEVNAGAFPTETFKALGARGLLGIKSPAAFGGLDGTDVAYCLAIRELARVCASTAVTVAVTNMVGDMIARFGTEAQQQAHLGKLCRGEYTAGSFALSEPQAGSDAASLSTTAVRDGDDYVLNGTKMWITSGDVCGVVLLMAKTDPDAKHKGITAFLVDAGAAGLSVGRHEDKTGLRGSSTVSLRLEDVRVPASAILAGEGRGFEIAMTALDGGRCGIGAQALGMAEGALAAATAALGERRKHAKADNTLQHLEFKLADMAVALEAGWLMVLRAAAMRDAGLPMTREAAMAKLKATEAASQICTLAVEVAGPAGLMDDSAAGRRLRDVRVTRIYEGTSQVQRIVIARSLAQSVS